VARKAQDGDMTDQPTVYLPPEIVEQNRINAQHERVEHDLTLHPPKTDDVASDMDDLRRLAKEFAHLIVDLTPGSREQSLALTNIETALFWAIASLARNQ